MDLSKLGEPDIVRACVQTFNDWITDFTSDWTEARRALAGPAT